MLDLRVRRRDFMEGMFTGGGANGGLSMEGMFTGGGANGGLLSFCVNVNGVLVVGTGLALLKSSKPSSQRGTLLVRDVRWLDVGGNAGSCCNMNSGICWEVLC